MTCYQGKASSLGESFEAGGMGAPGKEVLDRIVQQFAGYGLSAIVGG